MEVFAAFIAGIDNPTHRERTEEVLTWVTNTFPQLEQKIGWNQPMFTDHDTYIIGFSVAKPHLAVAPERAGMIRFAEEIKEAGYDQTNLLLRIRWDKPVDYRLLERIITFNVEDKADCTTFWRK
ncbi:iron chaperone [Paenibacillus glycanilyticus]|uniref:iron chaperone n=1 Tax=Paenibacillus glycanilyticus TaxID=126569 RepID=UPI00203AAEB5|nr:iron chaperone [Paenibacillus glycanilyticus]MCM3628359.1 iron chaperone [Paenibacillus glycanilyticus]